jgi:hypothetical protein
MAFRDVPAGMWRVFVLSAAYVRNASAKIVHQPLDARGRAAEIRRSTSRTTALKDEFGKTFRVSFPTIGPAAAGLSRQSSQNSRSFLRRGARDDENAG